MDWSLLSEIVGMIYLIALTCAFIAACAAPIVDRFLQTAGPMEPAIRS
jgi:hypothetical protein